MTLTITGRITDHQASPSLSGLRVEAWDAYLHMSEPVANAFTDGQGVFQIHLDEAYLQGLFSQQQPELYFKVFRGDELLANTQHSLTWRPGDEQSEIVIEIGTSVSPDATVIPPSSSALSSAAQQAQDEPALQNASPSSSQNSSPVLTPASRLPDLERLALDEPTKEMLRRNGYSSVAAIASGSRASFMAATRDDLGDFKAAQVHVMARAQEDMLKNIATGERVNLANGRPSLLSQKVADTVTPCDCPDCETAISPQAYLADLLVYTVEHVEQYISSPPASGHTQQDSGLINSNPSIIPKPLPPTITPNGGIFNGPVEVSVSCALRRTHLVYTLDGSAPSATPPLPSLPPMFQLTPPAMVRAICVDTSTPPVYRASDEAVAVFPILNKIDLPFLTASFCQPFGDLPTSCDAADEVVHQVRICIEVLRRYQQNSGFPPVLNQATAAYCLAAYTTLLAQLGTSYQELQLARTADPATRQSLADRLGIELGATRPDHLDALLLIPGTPANTLNEQNLELFFGLVDTTRDPLAGGPTFNDSQGQLAHWRLDGVNWGVNTDLQGKIYASVSKTSDTTTPFHVDLFSDANRTLSVAQGVSASSSGRVNLVETNESGLSGSLDLTYKSDGNTIAFQVIPEFLCWQFQHLRMRWLAEDWPTDAYSNNAMPVIDPDLIGPDDFRNPVPSGPSSTNKSAFDIWVERRSWVDGRLAALAGIKPSDGTPDMDGLLTSMDQPITYGATTLTPWPTITPAQLDELFQNLLQGVSIPATTQEIEQGLGLSIDSFTRLMDLRVKDQQASIDSRNPAVTDAEWQEVYAILVQAQKVKLSMTWIAEEQANGVEFDTSVFWISLSEPKTGDWPPSQDAQQPLIDPELLKLSDLPDPVAGQQARSIWQKRKTQLSPVYTSLQTTREQSGLNAALLQAVGDPNPGDPLPHNDNLDQLESDLQSNDRQKISDASATITHDLYMSVDSFNQFMAIRAKDQNSNPLLKPTAAEWSEVYAILTTAYKLKRLYLSWYEEENPSTDPPGKLHYWQALKARLPLWRSTVDDRQTWQQALLTRSSAPLIDSDLIDASYIRVLNPPNPALPLFNTRSGAVTTQLNRLQTTQEQATDKEYWLDQNLYAIIGIHAQDLSDLDAWGKQGNDITARLAQLGLSYEAFTYLAQMNTLIANNVPLLDSEWMAVYSILAQVWKEQQFGQWRRYEQNSHITLSPDFFQLTLTNGIPTERELPDWRATSSALSGWQGTLQARQGEQQARADALREAVGACEEATLPQLRDALIAAYDPTQTSLDTNANAVMQRFLIDARMGGDQQTTRIDQAIETIQNLLFSLRTGELTAHPELVLDDTNFDQSWMWFGTYANWSAALRVYLYPENTLQPTLRNWQSPGFENLVDDIRSLQQVSPKQAREAAQTYQDYFQDVCKLVVDATCYASTLIPATQEYRYLFYMFAHSSRTNNLYWSSCDPKDTSNYPQTPWQPLPGLDHTYKIIGVSPYNTSSTEYPHHWIYLFASSVKSGQPVFMYMRYNLDFGNWDIQPTELELPSDTTGSAEMVVKQSTFSLEVTPQLTLWTGTGVTLYQLSFDRDGTATNQWQSILVPPMLHTELLHLCASLEFLIAQTTDGNLYMFSPSFLPYTWQKIGTGQFIGAFDWPSPPEIYIFAIIVPIVPSDKPKPVYWIISPEGAGDFSVSAQYLLPGLSQLAFSSVPYGEVGQFACTFDSGSGELGQFRVTFNQAADYSLTLATQDRIVPYISKPFQITEQLSSQQLQARCALEQQMFKDDNAGASESVLGYLREAHYFVPIYLAQQLQQSGQYTSALDWYRVVYDYSQPLAQRKIYYGLEAEGSSPQGGDYSLGDDWLLDPLNPHTIAATRGGTYTRFTLLSLISCFLDYADAEYTRDTAESVSLARTLYLTAQSLLATSDLQQAPNTCSTIIGELTIAPDDSQSASALTGIKQRLVSIANVATLRKLVPQVQATLADTHVSGEERFSHARAIVEGALLTQPAFPTLGMVLAEQGKQQSLLHADLLQNQAVLQGVNETGGAAGTAFLQEVASISKVSPIILLQQKVELPWLSQNGASLTASTHANTHNGSPPGLLPPAQTAGEASSSPLIFPRMLQERYIPALPYQFCILANPVLQSLSQRADNSLAKIRSGRNIAGLQRQLQLTTSAGLIATGGVQGQMLIFQPTPYHYDTLIDRAKQLAQLANQTEAAMLSALEKRDNEEYNLLKARQDVSLAMANVQLQQLKVNEANGGVTLATQQQQKALNSVSYYQGLLAGGGISALEQQQMDALSSGVNNANFSSIFTGLVGVVDVGLGLVSLSTGDFGGLATVGQGFSLISSGVSGQSSTQSTQASLLGLQASYERRNQEWTFQEEQANQDVTIGNQQITIAQDDVAAAAQEQSIAQMQTDNDVAIINFLATKFTNADLYDWMSQVLGRVYRFFLQQATAMAQQASNQLAFERAQTPPAFIQSDYWQPPSSNATIGGSSLDGTTTDRNGLTGSARLLQDIYQLDQYAFTTDQRKLQLTKTLSLATLAPAEFQRFRETGVMTFATPLRLFDADFPGHYLRQIKQVRTTVIALIPPNQGIHASLSSTGVSRVVVGGDSFQRVVMRRDPETVALSSPMNATGVFELNAQSTLLNPFEDMGVDMTWEFSMPKAANLFDYSTIADVLISIDYTALDSPTYRQQVVRQLDRTWSADLPYSFRQQFADQWYDLNNPDQSATPMAVSFTTLPNDFPPNLTNLRIQQVVLYFARADGQQFEIPVTSLFFTPQNGRGRIGGSATSINGVISTRRDNANSWLAMIGKLPAGTWELTLPNTTEIRNHFQNGEITDILFVITYQGETPPWPG